MREENDIDLCTHMNRLKANLELAIQLWPAGRLKAMAGRIAEVQAAAREAEWRLNKLIREKEKV